MRLSTGKVKEIHFTSWNRFADSRRRKKPENDVHDIFMPESPSYLVCFPIMPKCKALTQTKKFLDTPNIGILKLRPAVRQRRIIRMRISPNHPTAVRQLCHNQRGVPRGDIHPSRNIFCVSQRASRMRPRVQWYCIHARTAGMAGRPWCRHWSSYSLSIWGLVDCGIFVSLAVVGRCRCLNSHISITRPSPSKQAVSNMSSSYACMMPMMWRV